LAKNVYIHIPFCKGKCNYCSFVSFDRLDLKEQYLNALKKQIQAEYKGEKFNTLYFGGGTPSLLKTEELKEIIELFNLQFDAEITIEVNPEGVNEGYFEDLKKIGINRISIGAQTFNDDTLKIISRRHASAHIHKAVNAANIYFDNISLDLIYGLPAQNITDFENDLKMAIDLGVQHVSLYGLKLEENCNFYKNPPMAPVPELEEQADMYLKAVEILKNAGFEHYEVSNFSKKGFESKHNLNYWNNNTYYGFGCSASGYVENVRYTNETNLEKYIENPLKKISEHKLSKQEIMEEAIFLGLRKIAGINIDELNQKFDIDFNSKYAKILEKYSKYFIKTPVGWALSLEGLLVSNEILSEFV